MNALKSSRQALCELANVLINEEMVRLSQANRDERNQEASDPVSINERIQRQKQLEAKQSSLPWLDEHELQELVESLKRQPAHPPD